MSYLLVCFIPLLFYANTISGSMENYFRDAKSKELIKYGNIVAGRAASPNFLTDTNKANVERQYLRDYCTEWNIERIMVLNEFSIVVYDSAKIGSYEEKLYASAEVRGALGNQSSHSLLPNKTKMHAAVPVVSGSGGIEENQSAGVAIGAVLVISGVSEINDTLSLVAEKRTLIAVVLFAIVAILVFFISQLLIDPLKNILQVVKKMSEGHLNQRITLTGHDEFAELATAFNDMSAKLEQAETSRSEFVSNVSHELKTPLSSMKVLSEALLLQDDVPAEMYKEFLTDITNEVDRMSEIINELLTLVKLDRLEQPLNIQKVNVTKLLEDVIKRLVPLADQKDINIEFEETRQFEIDADEMKLSLVFTNLVENAVKYTEPGGSVQISTDGDYQNVFITVKDNGMGITENEQPKVFERFYRIDKTRDRETGGTGLGLAIAQKIVMMHDGNIKLISKENEGSSFIVRLPV